MIRRDALKGAAAVVFRPAGDSGRAVTRPNGTQPRRPDQQERTASLNLPPASLPGNVFSIIIIRGNGITGLFQYQGTPGHGNGPILWAVPPTVTTDPFGNALPVSGGIASEAHGGGLLTQMFAGELIFGDTLSPATFTEPGQINTIHAASSADSPILSFQSPSFDAQATQTSLWLLGYPQSGGAPPAQAFLFAEASDPTAAVTVELCVCGTIAFGELTGLPLFPDANGAVMDGRSGYVNVTSPDGITYGTQRWTDILTPSLPLTINTANPSFQNIGPTVSIAVNGKMYVHLVYTEAAAAVPRFKLTVLSGAFSTSYLTGKWQQNNASASFGGQSTVAGPVAGPTMAGNTQILDLECEFIVSLAGSVQLQANTSVGADTFNIVACDIRWEPS